MADGYGRATDAVGFIVTDVTDPGMTNITTAMAMETSKGEFALGIALGIVLLTVAFTINGLLMLLQRKAR